ncbi:hypothetical protein KBC70_03150 [Candidatus Woesebacteria bacterium]|nr:hypothetical protein [Candidatus Woesebacteria bacterium]
MENFIVRTIQVSGAIISLLIVLGGIALMAAMTYLHLIHVVGLSPQEASNSTIVAINLIIVISACLRLLTLLRKKFSI